MSAPEMLAGAAVLELTVDNHPGVMVQVCSLFARRAYNMDAIACMPLGDGARSRIWIRVAMGERLLQVERQLAKLEDVLDVRRHGVDHDAFVQLEAVFGAAAP